MSKKYEVKVLEICDNGDAIIEIPTELKEDLGWEEGDMIEIHAEDGYIVLNNKSKEVK